MSDFSKKYNKAVERAVIHIFSNLLQDDSIEEVFHSQTEKNDPKVWIEVEGTIEGEIAITLTKETLKNLTKHFHPKSRGRAVIINQRDVIGELANLITGTIANQLQYINHEVRLLPPEFEEDPISMKALYENINLSFNSNFGGFDIDLYYRDLLQISKD